MKLMSRDPAKRDRPPQYERLQGAAQFITRVTAGFRGGMGLRIKWSRLSVEEMWRFLELLRTGSEGGAWAWTNLAAGEREELEHLIEKGADAAGIFEGDRQMAEIARLAGEAHRVAVKRPLTRKEEHGVFAEMARCAENGWLLAPHVGTLSLILVALAGGKPLGRGRVERVGDETFLVTDSTSCPWGGEFDPTGTLSPRWKRHLEHLERNEWLRVDRRGAEWWISGGSRLGTAMAGERVEDVVRERVSRRRSRDLRVGGYTAS